MALVAPSSEPTTGKPSSKLQFVVNLVNPRFHHFSKPLLLALLVGSLTVAAMSGLFIVEVRRERCVSLHYPTPQSSLEQEETQYVSSLNGQVRYVQKLRFGGSSCGSMHAGLLLWEEVEVDGA